MDKIKCHVCNEPSEQFKEMYVVCGQCHKDLQAKLKEAEGENKRLKEVIKNGVLLDEFKIKALERKDQTIQDLQQQVELLNGQLAEALRSEVELKEEVERLEKDNKQFEMCNNSQQNIIVEQSENIIEKDRTIEVLEEIATALVEWVGEEDKKYIYKSKLNNITGKE